MPSPTSIKISLTIKSSVLHAVGGDGRKQVIMKLRIRRHSTMRTKTANMNTRSIAFDPFKFHQPAAMEQ